MRPGLKHKTRAILLGSLAEQNETTEAMIDGLGNKFGKPSGVVVQYIYHISTNTSKITIVSNPLSTTSTLLTQDYFRVKTSKFVKAISKNV